ncbi:DUF72 domain-containing protein [Planococcus lenghuensis]|uniref:DUF72 domain-containing protein n=1 Tax=Planococcus lenghuensis TaxID=2213202 RepID=A0A1Q2KX23_9BACL|nr:DUF72 domain-containing protein [Planococcus lenghuensis]AQQ52693.1 hypothetical protein B0X71_05990 [Planococcus lenghuensis]
MLYTGLTGWGDHPIVYDPESKKTDKLKDYSTHFPIVELDSSFYAVQPERNIRKWISETPDNFQFVVKAYQGMTGHQRGKIPFDSREEMFEAFRLSMGPLKEEGKLGMILMQYPPWFDCKKENVAEIRDAAEKLQGFDVAVEFRNQTWYSPEFREKTIAFLKENRLIHSVCDEPQAGEGSIPFVPVSTREDKVLVRLHGRNTAGWKNTGGDGDKWRKIRYLYDYSEEELKWLSRKVKQLEEETKSVYLIFNNNSAGNAAPNAKQFQQLHGLEPNGLAPKQLGLFEGDD